MYDTALKTFENCESIADRRIKYKIRILYVAGVRERHYSNNIDKCKIEVINSIMKSEQIRQC